jgi:hypothetical protein
MTKTHRDSVTDDEFETSGPVVSLEWTEWMLAMAPEYPPSEAKNWMKCKAGCKGYRNCKLFTDVVQNDSIYEIAVTTPGKTKKHVVYYMTSPISKGKGKSSGSAGWFARLMHEGALKQETCSVINAGGRIYVRRGSMKKQHASRYRKIDIYLIAEFDYAWRKQLTGRRGHRNLAVDGFVISTSKHGRQNNKKKDKVYSPKGMSTRIW